MERPWLRASQAGFILALLLSATQAAANTLPNGLQLARFEISTASPPIVGSTLTVELEFKNVGAQPLQFDASPGIFVAARWNSTDDANARDFGHTQKTLVLKPGASYTFKASTRLDAPGTWRFWPGFRLNGQWGPFRWMEKTVEVFASPADAQAAGTPLFVSTLLKSAAQYDQKRVTVLGLALIVRKNRDSQGKPWTLMSLSDIQDNKIVLSVFGPGHPSASNGDRVRVSGVFKVKSPRGRYTFDNEIQVEDGGITVERTAAALEKADGSRRPIIDVRPAIGKLFDLGRVRANLKPLGAEIPLRFHARAYTHLPNPNTVVRTGMGTAGVKVVRVERRERPGTVGPTTAGPGKTWLIVHLAVRGNPANFGEPGNFYQNPFGYDLPPVFFVADAAGEVYWPDSSSSNLVVYINKGYKTLSDISTRDPNWTGSAAAFRVPASIRQPTLISITWQGEDRFELAGVRLE